MTHHSHGNQVGLVAFLMTQEDRACSYWRESPNTSCCYPSASLPVLGRGQHNPVRLGDVREDPRGLVPGRSLQAHLPDVSDC